MDSSKEYVKTDTGVVKSACRMCRRACGIDVYLRNGQAIEVKGTKENPLSLGILCPKGRAALNFIRSPYRLRYPMKRDGEGFQRISWDEAIDTIAGKLHGIKMKYGARSLAVFMGESAGQCDAVLYVRRFLDVFGSPNLFTGGSLCYRPIPIACRLTFGKILIPEPEKSRCVIIWGVNPYCSNRPQATQILNARKAGAKLIVIDPRRTFFAKKADVHIQPKPGSDSFLALAMLNVIISEGLYDKEFVDSWTTGFEKLKNYLADYTPNGAEEATGVPRDVIREAATTFATTRPASVIPGVGLYHQVCGVHNLRAISILQAITGNIEVPGGWIDPVRLGLNRVDLPEKLSERPLGEDKYPLFVANSARLEGQAAVLADTLITSKPYPVKAMIIAGGNPALSWPDTAKVVRALQKLDFLVVMDVTMTRTAALADVALPAATFMETTELHTYIESALPYVVLRKQTAEFPECWPDWKFWFQLARKMGYGEYFPWSNEDEAIDFLLKPSGITVQELKQKSPAGIFYGNKQYKTYERTGFPTPSGKIEIFSSKLQEMGYSPLPQAIPPSASRLYPLSLITGVRHLEYTHSQFRYIQSLQARVPEPLAEIHPMTAQKYGIGDGEMMSVKTPRGEIEIKAKVTEDIMPEVVCIPFGWEQANANVLTDWQSPDPISGLPVLVGLPCRIGAV